MAVGASRLLTLLRRLTRSIVLSLALSGGLFAPALADPGSLAARIEALALGDFTAKEAIVNELAARGDPAAAPALRALGDGDLQIRKADGKIVIAVRAGNALRAVDPATGEDLGAIDRAELDRIRINNTLRRALRAAVGSLTLLSSDPAVRRRAADAVFRSRDPGALDTLDEAIAAETDSGIRRLMEQARAAAILQVDRPEAEKLAAIRVIADRGGQEGRSILTALEASAEGEVKRQATAALALLEQSLAMWGAAQNVWYGLSLGSVLLLAAIGLAITFGVMGVINMAHGEMVMIGAYVTFAVQEVIRTSMPELFDLSLLIALPLAFLVAGAVGVAIERGVIRWLYGRPLETLLATWGISLVLQQSVRSIFGPSNREVGAPSWMSGSFDLGGLSLTYGRVWIIVFALFVFAMLLLVLRRTSFGLQMRAVTQNRRMAASMGIRTTWVDALTFGLGSGIAGVAGVALSQIDNVSPNLGQSYIIDSFMVVVFGGVGNLWGTLVGAMTLGVVNKFLEPYAGAVLGKILVLVFIILFIQKRPRGMFALKGRAVES